MVLTGAFAKYPVLSVVAVLGTLAAAAYVLLAYQRLMTGEPTVQRRRSDISGWTGGAVGVLLAILLFVGFYPALLSEVAEKDARTVMTALKLEDPTPAIEEGE
jgi:NADH-quinone oxidoreductase subunit M